jgi:hypothetical protein
VVILLRELRAVHAVTALPIRKEVLGARSVCRELPETRPSDNYYAESLVKPEYRCYSANNVTMVTVFVCASTAY